jgi:hypothetical protein
MAEPSVPDRHVSCRLELVIADDTVLSMQVVAAAARRDIGHRVRDDASG